jgi:glycerol transport system ATP-binding protein
MGGLPMGDEKDRQKADARFDHVFHAGEVCVVLGGNRAGKTDLCRYIAGLPSKFVGSTHLDGDALSPGDRRSVAMVFQAFVNYPNLSVFENIAAPLKHRKMNTSDIAAKVQRYAEMLGIADFLARNPGELSGGQQQRVAIARALAKEPRVLVLDEPLVNLDFKLRERLSRELIELLKETESIVVYASSDPRDAYLMGDEVLLMDEGNKLQSGKPMAVYREPNSYRSLAITSDPQANFWREGADTLAVRPEHIGLVGGLDDVVIEFQVFGVERSGAKTLVFGLPSDRKCSQEHWAIWLPGSLAQFPHQDWTEGAHKRVYIDPSNVHRFEAT